ncbi:hypothetical protein PMIN03_004603 [Paraphaeosphaeria minitans]
MFVSKEMDDRTTHKWLIDHWNRANMHGWQVAGLLKEIYEGWRGTGAERREARRLMGVWEDAKRLVDVCAEEGRKAAAKTEEVKEGIPAVKATKVEIEEEEQKEVSVTGTKSPQSGVQDTSTRVAAAGMRPCLKRMRSASDDDLMQESSTKRVKLDDFATVSSDHSRIVAHPFSPALCKQPMPEPHRPSDTYRAITRFARSETCYKPGRWASPEGFVKQHTSWNGGKWEKY